MAQPQQHQQHPHNLQRQGDGGRGEGGWGRGGVGRGRGGGGRGRGGGGRGRGGGGRGRGGGGGGRGRGGGGRGRGGGGRGKGRYNHTGMYGGHQQHHVTPKLIGAPRQPQQQMVFQQGVPFFIPGQQNLVQYGGLPQQQKSQYPMAYQNVLVRPHNQLYQPTNTFQPTAAAFIPSTDQSQNQELFRQPQKPAQQPTAQQQTQQQPLKREKKALLIINPDTNKPIVPEPSILTSYSNSDGVKGIFHPMAEKSPSWMTQYKKAIERQGSVSLNVIRCVLVGPPKVGKSCLKHLLVHNKPKEVTTSTPVLESPEVVTFTPKVTPFTATPELYMTHQGSSSVWQPIKDMGGIVKKWTMEEQYETQETQPTTGINLDEAESRPHLSQKSILTDKVSEDFKPTTLNTTVTEPVSSHVLLTALQEAHEQLQNDLEKGNLAHVLDQRQLTLVHVLDSGGQLAFQDTLPLLIGTPCTYITVFNASVDLDEPVDITYRAQDGSETKLDHQLSQKDMMLRTFSSVHTMEYKCHEGIRQILQDGSTLPHSRIAVVGTHKDKLETLPNQDDLEKKITKNFNIIEDSKPYQLVDIEGCRYFLINNLMSHHSDSVNSLRTTLSRECILSLKIPLMWLMLELTTQRVDTKFIPYNELKQFCLQERFISDDNLSAQFHSLIMFLHNLGFYAFYDLEGVSAADNWVCTDAATLYREVSKLLVVQYMTSPKQIPTKYLKSTGIIVVGQHLKLFKEIDLLPTVDHSWFFAVLQNIGIAAECIREKSKSSTSKELFIPLALPFNRVTPPKQTSVANLCFTLWFTEKSRAFSERYDLPRGIFPRFVVYLADRKHKSTPWRLDPHKSDRTDIKFLHNDSTIFLRERPGHLEVAILLHKAFFDSREVSPPTPAAIKLCEFCSSIGDSVRTALEYTCQEVFGEGFTNTAIIRRGFPCSCSGESSSHLALVKEGDQETEIKSSLCVRRDPEFERLTPQQQVWFTSEYLYNYQFTPDASGKYWIMEEAKTTLSSRKVSSQQDSQENPSDVVQHRHLVAKMSHSTSPVSKGYHPSTLKSKPNESEMLDHLGRDMSADWEMFAVHLNINPGVRDQVQEDCQRISKRCLLQVVKRWLQGEEGTGHLSRTWSSVVSAVEKCGHGDLAARLRDMYLRPSNTTE